MAVPYRRKPKSKSRIRRAANNKITLPELSICPNCGTKKLPHRVCLKCGYYKGRVVIDVEKFEHRFKYL
ncbi:MAG TPA: 50S ribosomal protein L32 [Spirochaetota bacterium]|nr:50S ribosomal protein L32 [Spirochaetota bacterium]HOM38061.1 50S ribosomal protein L32 [Spirochaetota bacterium]HPQ48864.1 50S ribosomal protein L32 [Spirochaetota bacterium]